MTTERSRWEGYATPDGGAVIEVTEDKPQPGDEVLVLAFRQKTAAHAEDQQSGVAGYRTGEGSFVASGVRTIKTVTLSQAARGAGPVPVWKVTFSPYLTLVPDPENPE